MKQVKNTNTKKIKKRKKVNKLAILFLIFIIVVIIFFVKLVMIFTESDEEAIYGKRLDGIEKVELNKSEKEKKIAEKLKDHVTKVTVRTQGRIVNIKLDVTKDVLREWAKDDCKNIMELFSEEEKKYYDFQYFVQKTVKADNSSQFPIIGYKHHSSNEIKWTKDR